MTAGHFVKHEVLAKGLPMPAAEFGPVSASTGSVLVFFVGAGFGWWSVGWVWLLAIFSVLVASVWGWKSLETELHGRITGIPRKLLGR